MYDYVLTILDSRSDAFQRLSRTIVPREMMTDKTTAFSGFASASAVGEN